MSTPIQTARDQLEARIEAAINDTNIPVLDHLPATGAPQTSVIIQTVGGLPTRPYGIGEPWDVTLKAAETFLRFQIDVYAPNHDKIDSLTDAILQGIQKDKVTLATNNVFSVQVERPPTDIPSEAGAKVYRKSFDIVCSTPLTWTQAS